MLWQVTISILEVVSVGYWLRVAGLDGADADALLDSIAMLSNLRELAIDQDLLELEALQALSVQRLVQLTALTQLTKLYLEGLGRNLQHWQVRTGNSLMDPRINVLDLTNKVSVAICVTGPEF